MEGFFQKRNYSSETWRLPEVEHSLLRPDDKQGMILVKSSQSHQLDSEPLYGRGWAYQEQMLPPRVRVYDSWLVWWEGLESIRTIKGNPDTINSTGGIIGNLPIHGRMRRIEKTPHDLKNNHVYLWKTWVQTVVEYTRRDLTIDSDRLPALSGAASRFSELWDCAYYAGLWEKKLLEGLGWSLSQPSTPLVDESLAASWSWVSGKGAVLWPSSLLDKNLPLEHPVKNTSIVCSVRSSH